MHLPLLSQSRRGGSYQTNKRAVGVRNRVRDLAGHDVGGGKNTTVTVSGEQDGGGVSELEGGQDQQVETGAFMSSRCTSTNSSIHEVYYLLGDEDSVADVAERVKATCSAIVSPAVAVNYNYTSGSDIEVSSESWEVVQWYRGSSFALALEGFNNTDTPIIISSALDSTFFTCLNTTISTTLPLPPNPNPIILKSHSGWHPNGSSKGGEIIVICFLSILFGPFALMLLAIVLLGILTVVCWCLEMCCTCCGLVSCSDASGAETPKPKPVVATRMPTPTKRMTWSTEKGGSQAHGVDSSYAGNPPRFPQDAVIAHTHRGAATQDWDTFRLLTGSHYHYDDSIMARAYHASQIPRSSNVNNDNIQVMPPKRLSLTEARSVLETRSSTTGTGSEGDKNPFVDSDSVDSVADSINEAPPRLSG